MFLIPYPAYSALTELFKVRIGGFSNKPNDLMYFSFVLMIVALNLIY